MSNTYIPDGFNREDGYIELPGVFDIFYGAFK